MHLDPSNRLHRGSASVMECPHCHGRAHMTPVATPDFRTLRTIQPAVTGLVLQCDLCNAPVFQRCQIVNNHNDRIDLQLLPSEAEKNEERFSYNYLPESVAAYYRDALGCYQHGLQQAFAAMCRLTTQAVISDRGDNAKLQIFAQADEIAELADLSDAEFQTLRNVLFDSSSSSLFLSSNMDKTMSAILLETLKDMLQQNYIRQGRLRKALRMRRFFADQGEEQGNSKVAPLKPKRSTGTS